MTLALGRFTPGTPANGTTQRALTRQSTKTSRWARSLASIKFGLDGSVCWPGVSLLPGIPYRRGSLLLLEPRILAFTGPGQEEQGSRSDESPCHSARLVCVGACLILC